MGEKFDTSRGENSYYVHFYSICSDAATVSELTTGSTIVSNYWIPSDYQYPIYPCYPNYVPVYYPALPIENKIERAFKIAKRLAEDDIVHFSSVEKFIRLVENLGETL